MSTSRTLVLVAALAIGGGGGARETPAQTTSTTSESTSEPAAAATTDEVLAVFDRSCARGCHAHTGGDPAATENGAYFDTQADVERLMDSYGVGIADSGLTSMLAWIERDGELRIGRARVLMPPAESGRPPITRDEAHRILAWRRAALTPSTP